MNHELELTRLETQIHSVQLMLGALAVQMEMIEDGVRRLVNRREGVAVAGEVQQETAATDDPSPCEHRNKQDVATMGNPGRWYCPDCQEHGPNI